MFPPLHSDKPDESVSQLQPDTRDSLDVSNNIDHIEDNTIDLHDELSRFLRNILSVKNK